MAVSNRITNVATIRPLSISSGLICQKRSMGSPFRDPPSSSETVMGSPTKNWSKLLRRRSFGGWRSNAHWKGQPHPSWAGRGTAREDRDLGQGLEALFVPTHCPHEDVDQQAPCLRILFEWHLRGRRLDPAWFHQTLQLIVGSGSW